MTMLLRPSVLVRLPLLLRPRLRSSRKLLKRLRRKPKQLLPVPRQSVQPLSKPMNSRSLSKSRKSNLRSKQESSMTNCLSRLMRQELRGRRGREKLSRLKDKRRSLLGRRQDWMLKLEMPRSSSINIEKKLKR